MGQRGAQGGDYPIEHRAGEVARLRLQGDVLAADTEAMLDRIGVRPRLALPRSRLRAARHHRRPERARRAGRPCHRASTSTPSFVAVGRAAAPANVAFMTGDAYRTGLADAGFDLVHVRFLACTAGDPERLVAEAVRLVRPGGYVAMQEADGSTLSCFPPDPAWSALGARGSAAFPTAATTRWPTACSGCCAAPGSPTWPTGPSSSGCRAGDPWCDYLPATVESLRSRVIERGLIAEADFAPTLAACRGAPRQSRNRLHRLYPRPDLGPRPTGALTAALTGRRRR